MKGFAPEIGMERTGKAKKKRKNIYICIKGNYNLS